MAHDPNVTRYREHLSDHSYEEYAGIQEDASHQGAGRSCLDLSLWYADPPPGVVEAIQGSLPTLLGSYLPAQDRELIHGLAEMLAIPDDTVAITAGADDALNILTRYCVAEGTNVLIPTPSFGRYKHHAQVGRANIHELSFGTFPYEFDVDTILTAIQEHAIHCLILASPNNPTGHALDRAAIERLVRSADCDIVLDEGLLLDTRDSNAALVHDHPNLFVCGSFSKMYALPGPRVGYLVAGTDHQRLISKLISPFAVSSLGLVAARCAIGQNEWLRQRITDIREGIAALRSSCPPTIRVSDTNAPIALLEYDGPENLYKALLERGVVTVPSEDFPGLSGHNAVRAIIKGMQEMKLLAQILADIS